LVSPTNNLPLLQKPSFHRRQWTEDGFFVLFSKKCPFQLRRKVRCDPSFLYSHAAPHIIWPGLGRSWAVAKTLKDYAILPPPANHHAAASTRVVASGSTRCLCLVLFSGSSSAKSFHSVHVSAFDAASCCCTPPSSTRHLSELHC
jgi:hypothetical protein